MTDTDKLLQQEALGIVGVNLLYGAFYARSDIDVFVASLLDGLSTSRIEIDMLEFNGPLFQGVDSRRVSVKLLKLGLTPTILLPPDGRVLQPSEVLFQRELIVERGRFRPVTHLHVDMLNQARAFVAERSSSNTQPLSLCEITLHNLGTHHQLGEEQLLAQVDELAALGYTVLVSQYPEFHRLITFFRRYTNKEISVIAGVDTVAKLFDEKFYADLDGGILEGLGRLFRKGIKLLVYPALKSRFLPLLERTGVQYPRDKADSLPDVVTLRSLHVESRFQPLLDYLLQTQAMFDVPASSPELLQIDTTQVLEQIRKGESAWERSVPAPAAVRIKQHLGIYTGLQGL
jgi:hypothetical protein